MREIEATIQDRCDVEPTKDFSQAFSEAPSVLVFLQRCPTPYNSYASFPQLETGWTLPHVISILGQPAERFSQIFEIKKGGYTGFFVRGGRQVLANMLGKPVTYVCKRPSVDDRSYTEWSVFYPGVEPQIKDIWRVTLSLKNQAVLTPEIISEGGRLPPRIHIPNFPYIFERIKGDASDLFEPEWVDKRVNEIGTRQKRIAFDPLEIRAGLAQAIKASGKENMLWGQHIDVPGAFVGKFARCLADIGLKVRASDALPAYVNGLREKGLIAELYLAEKLPKIEKGKFATVTFELYPLVGSPTFYLAMLREMIRSAIGIVFVEKKDCDIKTYVAKVGRDFNDYYPEIDAYTGFAQIYGLSVNVVDTIDLRFLSLTAPSAEQKERMYFDLRLMYALRRAVNHGHLNGKPLQTVGEEWLNRKFVLPIDTRDLATRLGILDEELVSSFNRVERGNSLATYEFNEETLEKDKKNGGLMSVLELEVL